ncbi:protein SSUH2 homolog isoform X5 [Ambystoma mexicanum]|uniref:protein SSUH2 homolog isoform X4 n=1 Tax=Ambystoma mexicanum TaxID=8296 RepID=UPI0037E72057
MWDDWNLRNAADPIYGSTNPLLGADFPGHPGAPGPYPPPVEGSGATAPPSHLMDKVSGYEGISTGGNDGRYLPPPPPYPGSGPGDAAPRPNVQWNIPSITEETAKHAFVQYAESKCCYKSAPAKEMVFRDFQPFNTYRYRLETFTESRSSEWKSVPYNGEVIHAYGTAPAPLPWDIAVKVPTLFKDGEEKVKVPYTSSVKPCQTCLSMGQTICQKCHGSGRVQCWVCNGVGRRMNDRCSHCNGMGNERCTTCHGNGRVTCTGCNGKRQLLFYIELKVTWKNNAQVFLADKTSAFPSDLFKKVTGKQLFTDEQFLVYPLMTFPDASINQASQIAIQQHNTQFASTSRILRQRHTIELIPLTKVDYIWKDISYNYFVYGVENLVFTEQYPAKCCCSVM